MWNLEIKLVCELLFTTKELTVEDMEESFQREDEQKKAKNGYRMSTVIKVHCSIPSPLRDFPNSRPDHLFLYLSLPIVAE